MKHAADLPFLRADTSAHRAEVATPGRTSFAVDIRATLQAEIEQGRLEPGALIDERALAVRFNVSPRHFFDLGAG